MSIVVNLDVMLAKRKMSSQELAEKIGITQANLSVLKTNKGKAIRFSGHFCFMFGSVTAPCLKSRLCAAPSDG